MNKKILITILIAIITLLSGCGSNNSSGYYNGIKWGSAITEVEQKLGDNITISDDKTNILQVIEDFENIEGSQAWIMYYFKNDKLYEITIMPSILNNVNLTDSELNQQLSDLFVKRYGECSKSDSIEQTWETKHSIITLTTTNYIKYENLE